MLSRLQQHLTGLIVKWGCEVVEFGGEGDHVHILIDAHPNLNLSSFVKNLKSVSSRKMRHEFGDKLQQHLWGGEFWRDGSTIISVGGRASLQNLIPYIQNQGKEANIDDAN
jgi:putative transposase